MDYIFVIRGLERLAIVMIAGLSIWGGVLLFKRTLSDRGYASAEFREWKIELRNLGPGIFFALFGSVILVFAMITKVEVGDYGSSKPPLEGRSGMTVSQVASDFLVNEKDLAALNTVLDLAGTDSQEIATPLDSEDLDNALRILDRLKKKLLIMRFGKLKFETWRKYKNLYRTNPREIPTPEKLAIVKEVEEWANAHIYEH